uniref:Uncharacterized protein n=1 Tax=Melanopsichium pennsylvanicum 4 TaxID=1398559 RepID=A0A077QYY8_9BASI|nr:hypothetical protein BN887_05590 [Melanopsichium pennsylvanicum 4]
MSSDCSPPQAQASFSSSSETIRHRPSLTTLVDTAVGDKAGSASQFVSLLGQPVAVSASLSAPDKHSAAATSAALPSLYKASRGRSTNVSPSRRWDRRGASATVLSGASASGSGGDDASEEDLTRVQSRGRPSRTKPHTSSLRTVESSARASGRRLSVPKEEALFPSDDDESPPLSPAEHVGAHAGNIAEHRRRSRRWSSIERERRRGMRILLQDRPAAPQHTSTIEESIAKTSGPRRRTCSANGTRRAGEEDTSDLESSSSPSSCTSSCDLNFVPRAGNTAAIPIKERRSRSTARGDGALIASTSVTSSQGQVPSSTDGSDDPSQAASTPSTSLVQRSPPGFISVKPIVAVPVTSESDPLLGLATHSVEDMIQVDKVEFFPEEVITAQFASTKVKRKASPKQNKKSSWIIGDFESESESDEERPTRRSLDGTVNRSHATVISASPPSSAASSYQARLASLQSQLRIWSRAQAPPPAPRSRQISASSEDQTETEIDANDTEIVSSSLLSASWRNLTRLPNLILLPGLAARQARESLTSGPKAHGEAANSYLTERPPPDTAENDFAQIYRLASSSQGSSDEKTRQAQRSAALKTGRPPSPSPSPSPPASLLGSRQSSNDSISTSDPGAQHANHITGAPRRGRGVASPLEADRDPSAYVSGLGQPIDPDTELSSVVQLQTFRSRSRSRPADVRHRGQSVEESRRHRDRMEETPGAAVGNLSPRKLGQVIELEPTEEERTAVTRPSRSATRQSPTQAAPGESLTVQIPTTTINHAEACRHDPFSDGSMPTDTASAPTSPTFRKSVGTCSSASSADEADTTASPPGSGESHSLDADGFRVVRRRHRRRSSGPRSLRPKVDAPVPQGFSAFAIDEEDENEIESDSEDEDLTPSPSRGSRRDRRRKGRDCSPRRSNRQCAVGLFGGGSAIDSATVQSTSRTRRSSRRDGSHISEPTPIRSVRSSPDLTYAAAAAAAAAAHSEDAEGQDADMGGGGCGNPSPPFGSRGRRGAVKVVNSSVGQGTQSSTSPFLGGLEGLRRGPSYPPRAGEILHDDAVDDAASPTSPQNAPSGRVRSASASMIGANGGTQQQAFRFRLLSNSSHLLMLSLELDMIKKQKISAPLKPRWGKHRANDFNPLPSTISYPSSARSKYFRSPFSGGRVEEIEDENGEENRDGNGDEDEDEGRGCGNGECTPCGGVYKQAKQSGLQRKGDSDVRPATIGVGGLRDPSSRLRYSWSLADIATALETAAMSSTQS